MLPPFLIGKRNDLLHQDIVNFDFRIEPKPLVIPIIDI